MDQEKPEIESDLVDLTDISLEESLTCDGASLAPMTSRVLDRIDDSHSSISGYNPQRPS